MEAGKSFNLWMEGESVKEGLTFVIGICLIKGYEMKKLLFSAAAVALLASAGSAYALDDNQASFNISADVSEGCTLKFNTTDMSFPKLEKSGTETKTVRNTFTVGCNGQPVHVDLDMGQNAGGGDVRYMVMKVMFPAVQPIFLLSPSHLLRL